jgi:hypothetical protein
MDVYELIILNFIGKNKCIKPYKNSGNREYIHYF